MRSPEHVHATEAQLDELLALAGATFPAPQYELLRQVLATFSFVMQALQNAKASLARFRKMLFGATTARERRLLDQAVGTHDNAAAEQASTTPLAACRTFPAQIQI
ncbi:MAG: hypothetical protein CRU78_20340 [Candidatus Accumulibacter phosphatis]|uniref:Uncharacterized protein n=1 Tax=Candidatus Accumulibacter phosphatis TaxID=327160 RepID=A0A6A7RYV0_9PROT|nr:hypothetical protein [Candidatus Accumulibacter phosphatis]